MDAAAAPRSLNGVRSVGVDVGGTFTDLVAVSDDGIAESHKVLSTPRDQSEGVEHAVRALGGGAERLDDIARLVHGTTVATNALLERAGARVALLATEGFTDLLELRRQDRASLFDLTAQHPPPLVAAADRVAVPERAAPEGVVRELTREAALACARRAADLAPDVVAIALLHAHAHPVHERLLADAIAEVSPGVDVVLSSDVFPEEREYERTATTTAEAYLRPRVASYLRRLADRLHMLGVPAPGVMTSSGGTRAAHEAAASAASLALSGPAGGVMGAAAALRAVGFTDALTIDIGGTSADVGLVLDGEPLVEPGGAIAGVPIALPRVLVETVSAGGGSVIWVDDGGALRVGPRSAGADPGPAAFGRGGTMPTLTDAHVSLGHVSAARLSGGVRLEPERARAALVPVADALGTTVERVAAAAVATADATMARALRRVSVQRGIDPRRCVLVAFGGGGPLHGCGLAERLGMSRVLVPPFAGVLSALGLAIAPERRESMASVGGTIAALDAGAVGALLERLRDRAGAVPHGEPRWWMRARYLGQGHELDVPVQPGDAGDTVAARFAELHGRRYGFTLDRPTEVVSARCAVSGPAWPVTLARASRAGPPDVQPGAGALVDDGLTLDALLRGPASVTLPDATLLVREGWNARALPSGGWLLEVADA